MKSPKKQCTQCEGEVHAYELQCPFCGAELLEESVFETPPPYTPSDEEEFGLPENEAQEEEAEEEWESDPVEAGDVSNPVLTLFLLIPGSVLFILGLALFLFSSEGKLVFEFSSKYWFLYLLLAWPMLFWGFRSLKSAPSEEDPITSEATS